MKEGHSKAFSGMGKDEINNELRQCEYIQDGHYECCSGDVRAINKKTMKLVELAYIKSLYQVASEALTEIAANLEGINKSLERVANGIEAEHEQKEDAPERAAGH